MLNLQTAWTTKLMPTTESPCPVQFWQSNWTTEWHALWVICKKKTTVIFAFWFGYPFEALGKNCSISIVITLKAEVLCGKESMVVRNFDEPGFSTVCKDISFVPTFCILGNKLKLKRKKSSFSPSLLLWEIYILLFKEIMKAVKHYDETAFKPFPVGNQSKQEKKNFVLFWIKHKFFAAAFLSSFCSTFLLFLDF